MRTVILAAAVAVGFSTAAMPANDGSFTTHHWTNGQYAQQANGPVDVYPNPASNRVNIIFPGLTGEAVVALFAEDGRLVQEFTVGETQATRSVPDISNLKNGVYFIRVIQPSGFDLTRRLMVAN